MIIIYTIQARMMIIFGAISLHFLKIIITRRVQVGKNVYNQKYESISASAPCFKINLKSVTNNVLCGK